VFNKLYVSMVDAGEKGGLLARCLHDWRPTWKARPACGKSSNRHHVSDSGYGYRIGRHHLSAVKVVPVFGEIYTGFGAKLPGPTQFLITISNIIKDYILYILPAMGLAVYGWFFYIKTKPGRESGTVPESDCHLRLDRPQNLLARFTRTARVIDPQRCAILEC